VNIGQASLRLSNIHLWFFTNYIHQNTTIMLFSAGDKWPNIPDLTSQNRLWSKNYWTKSGDLGIMFLLKIFSIHWYRWFESQEV
jgi:hypothetical protein